jgi:endonuclease YncB( thermonuclease family)
VARALGPACTHPTVAGCCSLGVVEMGWQPRPEPSKRSRLSGASIAVAAVLAVVTAVAAFTQFTRAQAPVTPQVLTIPRNSAADAPNPSAKNLPVIVTRPNDSSFIQVKPPSGNVPVVKYATSGAIQVIDGDTVRSGSVTYRLVGFDTPERGDRATCEKERALADRATARLQQLLASGTGALDRVPCACRSGTEGSQACNYGRLCARLRVAGTDVGDTLIREGLAQPFECNGTLCPPRKPWC